MKFNSIHRLNPRKFGFGAYEEVFKVQDPHQGIFAVKKIKFLKFEETKNKFKWTAQTTPIFCIQGFSRARSLIKKSFKLRKLTVLEIIAFKSNEFP